MSDYNDNASVLLLVAIAVTVIVAVAWLLSA